MITKFSACEIHTNKHENRNCNYKYKTKFSNKKKKTAFVLCFSLKAVLHKENEGVEDGKGEKGRQEEVIFQIEGNDRGEMHKKKLFRLSRYLSSSIVSPPTVSILKQIIHRRTSRSPHFVSFPLLCYFEEAIS
jgi:hypothetical protein